MIRELSRKEYRERRPLLGIALALVLLVTASLPFVFSYSLAHALRAAGNDTALLVLRNFRSYSVFIESQWLARNLSRILCLLALIAGSGAIAGEREGRTYPLLYTSAVPLQSVLAVKFLVIAAWLCLVTFSSAGVLAAHTLLERAPLSIPDLGIASCVAWANALAFLGVVFAASSLATKTYVAAGIALVSGFAIAALLSAFGLPGTALADNVFAVDGSVRWDNAWLDVLVCALIAIATMTFALFEVERRRAT